MDSKAEDEFQIPVLDITHPKQGLARGLVDAAEKYGFIFIRYQNGEISPTQIDRAFDISKQFFNLPIEEKSRYAITENNRGWSAMHTEKLDPEHQRKGDFKECFNMADFLNGKAQQPLPPLLMQNEDELCRFSDSCHNLCMKILQLFAIGLGIDAQAGGEEWFSSRHDPRKGPTGSILRFLHYPSITSSSGYSPEVDLRAGAHSDYGSITLLFQRPNEPGLEILTPWNTWHSVPVYPSGTKSDASPPILVNIGDLLSYWTNGLLKSTVHRVVTSTTAKAATNATTETGTNGSTSTNIDNTVTDRFSIAYFCHPVNDTLLEPIPSERVLKREESAEKGKHAKVLTALEHLNERLAATYTYSK